jgi:MFS family permease
MDRRIIILGSALAATLAGLLLALSGLDGSGSRVWLFIAAFLFGAGAFPIGSLANALMNDHAPRSELTEVAGGLLLLYGASAVVGPIAVAITIGAVGYDGLFYFTAIVHGLLCVLVFARMLVKSAVPAHERGQFEAQPQGNAVLIAPAEAASQT